MRQTNAWIVAGRWLFTATWFAILGFGAAGAWRYATEAKVSVGPAQLYGIQLRDGDGTAVQFPLGREASEAGLRAGARIVAVNGQPIDRDHSVDARLIAAEEPPSADFSISTPRGDGKVRLHRSPDHARAGFGQSGITPEARLAARVTIFILTMFAAPVGFATLLLLRRRTDPLARWASLAMVLNALGSGPALYAVDGADRGPLYAAVAISCPLAGWAQIAILAMFPETHWRSLWTKVAVLGSIPLMYWMQIDSTVFETNSALLFGQLIAVAVVLKRYRAMPRGVGRQQIRWALFGFAASLLTQGATIFVQKLFFATADAAAFVWLNLLADVLAGLAMVLLFGAMTVGLMRYRLYDADATISRSIAYGALTLSLLAIFAGSEKVIEALGEEYLGASLGALANGLGAAVAAAMIGPLHHRVTHWAEKRFRSGLVRLRHGLPLLVQDMRETATPLALADAMLERVEKGVRARHAAVVVHGSVMDTRDIDRAAVAGWLDQAAPDDRDVAQLSCDRRDPVFPLRVPLAADGAGTVGWLLLGPRPDGTFYGREERDALQDIADPVARALAIAIRREAREIAAREREEQRDRRVNALQRFVQERFGFDGNGGAVEPGAA